MAKDQKQRNARRFAEQLRTWLNDKGFSQAELARRSGLRPQTIGQYLAQKPHHLTNRLLLPEIDTVDRIARALGVSITEARAAAGYTHDLPYLDTADKFALIFRELSPQRQVDILRIMAALQSADSSAADEQAPINDLIEIAESKLA